MDQESLSSPPRISSRKSLTVCAPPSCEADPDTIPCLICGLTRKNKVPKKYKLCEDESTRNLVRAIKYKQDKADECITHEFTENQAQFTNEVQLMQDKADEIPAGPVSIISAGSCVY